MSIVNTRDRTILTKVVYYGPGLGGKTTSLSKLHQTLDPDGRTRLVSIRTDEERTLYFDFMPLEIGVIEGYRLRIQAYTVPGQVKYNQTRRHVLIGADAVVFVADSQAARLAENMEAKRNLGENLRANGIEPEEVPTVLQYNKRDLAELSSLAELDEALRGHDCPRFESVATQSEGVLETFVAAVRLMLDKVAARYELEAVGEGSVGDLAARRLRALGARAS